MRPEFSHPFLVQTDWSQTCISAVLSQRIDGKEHVIAYQSRTLTPAEQNYSANEGECLAALYGVEQFRPYVHGAHFTVETNHSALKWLMPSTWPNGKRSRWVVILSTFDFDVVHRSGRTNGNADALSRLPREFDSTPPAKQEYPICCGECFLFEEDYYSYGDEPNEGEPILAPLDASCNVCREDESHGIPYGCDCCGAAYHVKCLGWKAEHMKGDFKCPGCEYEGPRTKPKDITEDRHVMAYLKDPTCGDDYSAQLGD